MTGRTQYQLIFSVLFLLCVGSGPGLVGSGSGPGLIRVVTAADSDEPAAAADADDLATAVEHLQKGRYEEALEAFEPLIASENDALRIPAVLGVSRALESKGDYSGAIRRLSELSDPPAKVLARLAELQRITGRLEESAASVEAALKLNAEQPLAKLVLARLYVASGQLDKAGQEFRWFVRYYNREQPTDAETLLIVAKGAAEYARWNSVSSIFSFIVNTLCPDALKDDPLSWQTHATSGLLLLEKFNQAQAIPDLKKALEINPRAVSVIVAIGEASLQKHKIEDADTFVEQALKVQPNYVPALRLKADVEIARENIEAALEALQQARDVNSVDAKTLGRFAACYYLLDVPEDAQARDEAINTLLANLDAIDDVAPEEPSRLERVILDVAGRNPRPGEFLNAFAQTLETRRKYPLAEKLYRHTIRVMPQLSEPKTSLGMLYMQTGRTDQAEQILDDAFEADPYHVRVSNMRKVLNVLDGYGTISTDHFVVRFDSEADRILAEYMSEYLEEIYDELVELYGFEPPQRTTFEIYHNAKGLSAHQWFSARMVGLPWIQTIGASTGMMVALASPTASEKQFNWARVVKHEFVHVVTLQQTRFNIPHWFTEALAVTSEGTARPAVWNRLLMQRVPRGELWSLDELTSVFVRPDTPLDWQFAYCQSRLYAQYMIEKFGEDTIGAMLKMYRQNVRTEEAIPKVFGVSVEEFESGYHEFLNRIVQEELGGSTAEAPKSISDLEKEFTTEPENPEKMAAFAEALFEAGRRRQARELAEQALDQNPDEPLAAAVMAQLELRAQDLDEAAAYLEQALDESSPNATVLGLLARIRLKQAKPEEAARLYELGREKFNVDQYQLPETDEWLKGLAAAYVQLEETEKLREVLETIARLDGDNAVVRRKLAQLAADRDDLEAAGRWATEAVHIDVMDAGTHRILARYHEARGNSEEAERERRLAEQLK